MLNDYERDYIIQMAYKSAGVNVAGLVAAHDAASSLKVFNKKMKPFNESLDWALGTHSNVGKAISEANRAHRSLGGAAPNLNAHLTAEALNLPRGNRMSYDASVYNN